MDIRLGDILRLKKEHPCGNTEWLVLRTGIDFRLRCCGCAHEVMIPREKLEKRIRQIRRDGAELRPADLSNPALKNTESKE